MPVSAAMGRSGGINTLVGPPVSAPGYGTGSRQTLGGGMATVPGASSGVTAHASGNTSIPLRVAVIGIIALGVLVSMHRNGIRGIVTA